MDFKKFTDFYESKSKDEVTLDFEGIVSTKFNEVNLTENYKQFSENIKKAAVFAEQIETLSNDLNLLVNRGEFESTLTTLVVHVNENIQELKNQLSNITKKDLDRINSEISSINSKVRDVLQTVSEQTDKNKKTIFEGFLQQDKKLGELKNVVSQIDGEQLDQKLNAFNYKIEEIESVINVKVPEQDKKINKFLVTNEEIIKNTIAENDSFYSKVDDQLSSINLTVKTLDKTLDEIDTKQQNHQVEISKIKNNLVETSISNKKLISESENKLDKKIESTIDSVLLVNTKVNEVQEQVINLKETVPLQKSKLVSIESDLTFVQKDVDRIKKDKTLGNLKEKVANVEKDIFKLNNVFVEHNLKIGDLNTSLNEATLNIKKITGDKKFDEINKKINHFEEILSKFNNKTVLTEDIYPTPSVKTSDPLTPLNQNFVTFEQLQKHYSLFINRIQQQLMTLGGGGSSKLWDLDDTDYYSVKNPADGNVLKYVSANAKWEAGVVSAGSSFDQNLNTTNSVTFASLTTTGDVVVTGNLSVLGNTTVINSATLTIEDKNIVLANGSPDAATSNGAGITVDGAGATITYISSSDSWQFNKNANVQGNIAATGTITSPFFYSESDIALKEDVNPISNALKKVLKLTGVDFIWKTSKQKAIGVIAQDVERVVPEIVSSNSSGSKTVSYDSLIPLLIEAIKEQQTQIDDLRKKVK